MSQTISTYTAVPQGAHAGPSPAGQQLVPAAPHPQSANDTGPMGGQAPAQKMTDTELLVACVCDIGMCRNGGKGGKGKEPHGIYQPF